MERLTIPLTAVILCAGANLHALFLNFEDVEGGTIESKDAERYDYRDIMATSKEGWKFEKAEASPIGKRVIINNSNRTLMTSEIDATFHYVNFTLKVAGEILPTGDGEGPVSTDFSLTNKHTGYDWYIYIDPENEYYKVGDKINLFSKIVDNGDIHFANKADWKITPSTYVKGGTSESYTAEEKKGKSYLELGGDWVSPAAGTYKIEATLSDNSERTSRSKEVTFIGIDSFSASDSYGNSITSKSSDSNEADRLFTRYGRAVHLEAVSTLAGKWPSQAPVINDNRPNSSVVFSGGKAPGVEECTAKCGIDIKKLKILFGNIDISTAIPMAQSVRIQYSVEPSAEVENFDFNISIGKDLSETGKVTQGKATTVPAGMDLHPIAKAGGKQEMKITVTDPKTKHSISREDTCEVKNRRVYSLYYYLIIDAGESGTGTPEFGAGFYKYVYECTYGRLSFFVETDKEKKGPYWFTDNASYSSHYLTGKPGLEWLSYVGATLDDPSAVNITHTYSVQFPSSSPTQREGVLQASSATVDFNSNGYMIRLWLSDEADEKQTSLPDLNI